MTRYLSGFSFIICMLISCTIMADPLDDQFALFVNGEEDQIKCFDPSSSFEYCLRRDDTHMYVVDKHGKEVYRPYFYDNGQDYPEDGLYRIVKNNKIGYAEASTGHVIIAAQYDCAYPFMDGKAKVGTGCGIKQDGEHSFWTGGKWQTINNPIINR